MLPCRNSLCFTSSSHLRNSERIAKTATTAAGVVSQSTRHLQRQHQRKHLLYLLYHEEYSACIALALNSLNLPPSSWALQERQPQLQQQPAALVTGNSVNSTQQDKPQAGGGWKGSSALLIPVVLKLAPLLNEPSGKTPTALQITHPSLERGQTPAHSFQCF